MTTHETDRSADYDSVEENEETVGDDRPTDEQYDRGADTDADVGDAELEEPVEDEPETALSRAHDTFDEEPDEETDEAEVAEPELVDADEADELTTPEPADPAGRSDPVTVDRTSESDPLQKLAPVGADTAMDPGTGSYDDRWGAIQAGFIDDPRRTAESASALVAEIWDEIVRGITDEREDVDRRWQSTESSTDDLIVAMQDYRALYSRLTDFTSR